MISVVLSVPHTWKTYLRNTVKQNYIFNLLKYASRLYDSVCCRLPTARDGISGLDCSLQHRSAQGHVVINVILPYHNLRTRATAAFFNLPIGLLNHTSLCLTFTCSFTLLFGCHLPVWPLRVLVDVLQHTDLPPVPSLLRFIFSQKPFLVITEYISLWLF